MTMMPSRKDRLEKTCRRTLGLPGHTKTVAVGGSDGLVCGQTLIHDRVILIKQDIVEIDVWSSIGHPPTPRRLRL